MKLKELQKYLDELLPLPKIVDYCPNGLQVEGKTTIQSLATAVSANLETIEAAVQLGVDALIVHHGLFWNRDSFVIQGTKRKKLFLLLEQEISLFAYHLPLDLHATLGNNWRAAEEMGWKDCQPFAYLNGVPIGVKGNLSPCTPQQLKIQLEDYYQHPATWAAGGPDSIQTIALVSGGSHKTLLEAAQEKVDAFVTGSFDEPTWHEAKEEGIHFFALGHSATERIGPRALAQHLEQSLCLPCRFLDIANPF